MKIAVSGERFGRALPSTLNILINYFRPVSVNKTTPKVVFCGKILSRVMKEGGHKLCLVQNVQHTQQLNVFCHELRLIL